MATYYVKNINGTLYYKSGSEPTVSDASIGDLEAVIELAGVTTGDSIYLCAGTYAGTMINSDSLLTISKKLAFFGGAPGLSPSQVILDFGDAAGSGVHPSAHGNTLGSHIMGRMTLQNISTAATNYCFYSLANNWVFSDLIITGGYSGIYAGSASNIFQRVKVSGITGSSIYCNASVVFNSCIIVNGSSGGIIVYNAASPTFNNCIISGFANEGVENTSTGTVTLNNCEVLNTCLSSSTKYPLTNDSIGTITATNCLIQPNKSDPTRISTGGMVTITSPVYASPQWIHSRRAEILTFGVDGIGNLDYFYDTVMPMLEARGWRGTFALSQSATATAGQWVKIRDIVSRGHTVSAHGETFSNMMTDRNAFTIQYTGSGSACSMSVTTTGDWAGTITTTATGASGDNKSITITPAMALSDLAALFGAKYTVTVNNTDTSHNALPVKYLSTATYSDIKTSATQIVMDHTRIAYGEMRDAKALIEANVPGYTVQTFVCPGNASDATLRTDLAAMGYKFSRGSGSDGEFDMTSISVYNIKPQLLYTFFGSDANPQNTAGKVAQYFDTQIDYLKWIGGITSFYAHSTSELSSAGWNDVLTRSALCGATVLSADQAYASIVACGSTSDNITYTRTWTDLSNYHLRNNSPCISTGLPLGLTSDFDGNPIIGIPSIGAFQYTKWDGYGWLEFTVDTYG